MPKRLFAVVLTDEQDKGGAKITENYRESEVYRLAEDTYIVAHDGLSRDVAKSVGIFSDTDEDGTEPGEVSGVVLKLNGSYTGYASQDIWEWLDAAEKET